MIGTMLEEWTMIEWLNHAGMMDEYFFLYKRVSRGGNYCKLLLCFMLAHGDYWEPHKY
jgi:hypothetical protein